ncbi:MAG: DUF1398 domain-containing protein [Novosphingobium sp.]
MDAERIAVAQQCLEAAYDGSMSFPQIVQTLAAAGFESYAVDFRRGKQAYYLPDGDHVELDTGHSAGEVGAEFDSAAIEAQVRWAQANGPDYSYGVFCERVEAAGCAGYQVSFLGRRAVYYGRTAETHVELFPR